MSKKKPAKKVKRPNLHEQLSERRGKRPVGHEGGKRVAALRHRANVIPSNGDLPTSTEVAPEKIPIGEAMRKAVEELGDVVVDNELAPQQLRELGDCFEEVTRRRAAYNARAEEAKTAKKGLDAATELLLEKVRTFTHPKPLPLFDQKQAEEDLSEMIGAGEVETVEDATELGLDGAPA